MTEREKMRRLLIACAQLADSDGFIKVTKRQFVKQSGVSANAVARIMKRMSDVEGGMGYLALMEPGAYGGRDGRVAVPVYMFSKPFEELIKQFPEENHAGTVFDDFRPLEKWQEERATEIRMEGEKAAV